MVNLHEIGFHEKANVDCSLMVEEWKDITDYAIITIITIILLKSGSGKYLLFNVVSGCKTS